MKQYIRQFRLEDASQISLIQQQLAALMPLQISVEEVRHCTYYDSFDWRLYKKQKLLVAQQQEESLLLYLENLPSGVRGIPLQVKEMPRFAWHLPDSPLREEVDALLDMRALLPQLNVALHESRWNLLDKTAQQVLLSLRLSSLHVHSKHQVAPSLPTWIVLEPVQGEGKVARKISEFLQSSLHLPVEDTPLAVHLLSHSNQPPSTHSSSFAVPLEPTMAANQAVKQILKVLLTHLRDNEPGVLADLDTEFLHNYRVAVRRTRTVLGQIKQVLPKSMVERMRKNFAQLGEFSTPVRDLDVYLLNFEDYRALLPQPMQPDLEPLLHYLQQQRAQELGRLQRHLQTATHKKFIRDWQVFLNAAARPQHSLTHSAQPIKTVADECIWQAYSKMLKMGEAITPDSPADALHEVRKQGKKLRYLIEFFNTLYAPKKINKLIKNFKIFQETLGAIQDYAVQANYLRTIADALGAAGTLNTAHLLAMGMLVGHIEQLQQQARAAFSEHFQAFADAQNQQLFSRLFKSP